MSENQVQLPANILNALQMFANTAWHLPATFRCTHLSHTLQDVECFCLQGHSVALQYLFGSAFAWYNKILVRDEYREALQALQTDSTYQQGMYIIGQPGIGKTCFLLFALLERLREHKPVAIQLRATDACYLLLTHTCTPCTISDPAPLAQDGVWALSDLRASDASLDIFQHVCATVVQTASPSWESQTCDRGGIFVMNTWSEDEITDLGSLVGLDVARMTALAGKWGGVPRTVLQQYTNDDPQQDWERRRAARYAVENYMALLTNGVCTMSTIFFVLPLKDHTGAICRRRHVLRVPTPTLQHALAMALREIQDKARINFFLAMFGHPATRSCAKHLYANWLHSLMTSGKALSYMWKGGSTSLRDALDALQATQLPIVRDAAARMHPPYYWVSHHGEFPGIDCALVTKSTVHVMQVVTLYCQPVSPRTGLDKLQALWKGPRYTNISWKFRFVSISVELASSVYERWQPELVNAATAGCCVVDPAEISIADMVYVEDEDEE